MIFSNYLKSYNEVKSELSALEKDLGTLREEHNEGTSAGAKLIDARVKELEKEETKHLSRDLVDGGELTEGLKNIYNNFPAGSAAEALYKIIKDLDPWWDVPREVKR